MTKEQALGLVDSVIDTHACAVQANVPRAAEALENARLDLHALVNQIFDDCIDLVQQARDYPCDG
jgi:hypothetical protein